MSVDVSERKRMDYQVTLRVSLGAAYAFATVFDLVMSQEDTRRLFDPEWLPQIEKDLAAIKQQIAAQELADMYTFRAGLFRKAVLDER